MVEKWWIQLASRTTISHLRILAINFVTWSEKIYKLLEIIKINHLRQSPQTLKFFVNWIKDGLAPSMKWKAIANLSLCPHNTDSIVSPSFKGRVIQLES